MPAMEHENSGAVVIQLAAAISSLTLDIHRCPLQWWLKRSASGRTLSSFIHASKLNLVQQKSLAFALQWSLHFCTRPNIWVSGTAFGARLRVERRGHGFERAGPWHFERPGHWHSIARAPALERTAYI